ncbi:extracellular fatty acid-binding protein [Calypte anna]|uniref:extracellular fatty acid-binding protein n=1 Tax=Calypte anna TaxID=9244 RepID=UPI0004C25F50|nr:extracellular fatty acid-binding protein [Calypte anna]
MRTVMLSLGLVLLCLLSAEAGNATDVRLDKSKIGGKWYIVAMASDSEEYIKKKDSLKVAMANVTVLEDGDLNVSFAIPTPVRCLKFSSIYKPTDIWGYYYRTDRGNKTVQALATDSNTYMIVFATRVKNGKTLHMLRLYSRTEEVNPEVEKLFKKLAKDKSFSEDTIWKLPRQDECKLDEA